MFISCCTCSLITGVLNNVILPIPFVSSLMTFSLLENVESFFCLFRLPSVLLHTSFHFFSVTLNKWGCTGCSPFLCVYLIQGKWGPWLQVYMHCVHAYLIWAKALRWRVRFLFNAVTIDKASRCLNWPKMCVCGKTCDAVTECWLGIWQSHLFS